MKNRGWIAFSSVVITYIASRVMFAALDFSYNFMSDPFDLGKLIVDAGAWGVLYVLSYLALTRMLGHKTA